MGKFELWVDDDGIIHGALMGIHTKSDAERAIKEINTPLFKSEQKSVIFDMGDIEGATLDATRAHIANIKKPIRFQKLVLFGANRPNRVMMNLFMKISGRNPTIRYFQNKKGALKWLKE
jgi:hypothetical protein